MIIFKLKPGKDLLISFDVFHQIPSPRWSSKGLLHKQHLLTWTQVPHLFTVDPYGSLRTVKTAQQDASLHQGEVHFVNQISSQLQGDKDIDQTTAMAMIEVMPHYDQVLYSMQ